jgi:hypothetical protein
VFKVGQCACIARGCGLTACKVACNRRVGMVGRWLGCPHPAPCLGPSPLPARRGWRCQSPAVGWCCAWTPSAHPGQAGSCSDLEGVVRRREVMPGQQQVCAEPGGGGCSHGLLKAMLPPPLPHNCCRGCCCCCCCCCCCSCPCVCLPPWLLHMLPAAATLLQRSFPDLCCWCC